MNDCCTALGLSSMAFLTSKKPKLRNYGFRKLRTRIILVHEDMMNKYYYSDQELHDIRTSPTFGGWNMYGYYIETPVQYVTEWSAKDTYETPNRRVEDVGTYEDFFCNWLIPIEERV